MVKMASGRADNALLMADDAEQTAMNPVSSSSRQEPESLFHEELNEAQPLLKDDDNEEMDPTGIAAARSHGIQAHGHGESDDGIAKRVLQKIDWTIIPLLFVTYMFNFMDKSILSSAAVFGLREDNVRELFPLWHCQAHDSP